MTFPDYGDAVDVAQLQTAVAEMIASRTKSGEKTGTIAVGQTSVAVDISFPTPFATTPRVTAQARSTFGYTTTLATKSATGATIQLHRPAGAPTTAAANVQFDWVATDLGNA